MSWKWWCFIGISPCQTCIMLSILQLLTGLQERQADPQQHVESKQCQIDRGLCPRADLLVCVRSKTIALLPLLCDKIIRILSNSMSFGGVQSWVPVLMTTFHLYWIFLGTVKFHLLQSNMAPNMGPLTKFPVERNDEYDMSPKWIPENSNGLRRHSTRPSHDPAKQPFHI